MATTLIVIAIAVIAGACVKPSSSDNGRDIGVNNGVDNSVNNNVNNSTDNGPDPGKENGALKSTAQPGQIEQPGIPMSSDQLDRANLALSHGTTIDDPLKDWIPMYGTQHDGKSDNPDPYPAPFCDYTRLTIAADDQYLYAKTELNGVIPADYSSVPDLSGKGDKITTIDLNLQIVDGDVVQSLLSAFIDYGHGQSQYEQHSIFTHNTGDPDEFKMFRDHYNDALFTGGFGHDYILQAFPLGELGLKRGDSITIQASIEAGSDIYHHALVDNLGSIPGQNEKFPALHRITI